MRFNGDFKARQLSFVSLENRSKAVENNRSLRPNYKYSPS
jgi:hypothetical protein